MKKLFTYIVVNFRRIIIVFLISVFFTYMAFVLLAKAEPLRTFLNLISIKPLVGLTALVWLLALHFWEKTQKFWERYRNTWRLEKPPFFVLHYVLLFVVFSILLLALSSSPWPHMSVQVEIFVATNLVFFLAWAVTGYYWRKEEEEETKPKEIDTYSLSDEPIQFREQDLLGREEFVEGLYKELTTLPFADSFVFGLYGSWGEGKTSVVNLLRNKFEGNQKFLIIDFDPWHFKDEESILSAFYKELERAISQEYIFPDLRKTFSKYRSLITSGLSQIGIKVDLSITDESLEELKQRIESYITQIRRKVAIFIDDIDRLQNDEILAVFKLIRLNANFENTIFFLSFDPVVIQNRLEDRLGPDPEFLDKIVQKPVPLPAIEQRDIDKLLDVNIDRLFDEIKIPKEVRLKFEKELPFIYQTQMRKLFKTMRHAKRYLNGLRSTLPPVKNEVNLYDFFILEVIRIFYPRVYDDIWRNPWYYIPLNWSDETFFLYPFRFGVKEDEKYALIKTHIEEMTKDERESEALRELLESIFFVEVKNAMGASRTGHDGAASSYRAEKRITHPQSFKKYFMLKVPLLEISDEFLETTLVLWHSSERGKKQALIEKTIFKIQKEEKLLELFKKLLVFMDNIDREVALALVRVIYSNADKFSRKGTENLWNSEYDKARSLLLWLTNEKLEKDQIHTILEEAVKETLDLPFAVSIVQSCRQGGRGSLFAIYDSVRIDDLQNKVASRLKKYFVDKGRDIFDELKEDRDWAFVLHQWATNWMTFTGSNNRIVNDYVLSLVKDDAKKFVVFLMSQRKRTVTDEWTYDLGQLGRIYNLDELQELAGKFKGNKSLTEEGQQAIETFFQLNKERLEQAEKGGEDNKPLA